MINFNYTKNFNLQENSSQAIFLSDHFTLFEMTKSLTATRLNLSNCPNEKNILALRHLCHGVLEPVRKQFRRPFSPLSGFRSKALNKAVGGSENSQHLSGHAVDIELSGVDNYALAKWIRDNLTFDQLVLEFYVANQPCSGWVHVSLLDEKNAFENRGQVLTRNPDQYCSGLKA